jgi:ubiquinone/menaquinone biosynthesis C-methylase UbiE
MKSDNKYTQMQKKQLDIQASKWSITDRDHVVGSFDSHNKWQDYDDFLFKNVETQNKIALDFGCGPGRCIVKFANRFARIDGIDISEINLNNVKVWTQQHNISFIPNLYLSNGVDLSIINDNIYDVVYSTICLQHICVYEIRLNLLKEFHRVLKSGGHICLQMGFGKIGDNQVNYYENYYDAVGTNGGKDVDILDVNNLKSDMDLIGFKNFEYDLRPVGPGDGAHAQWIFFRAQK